MSQTPAFQRCDGQNNIEIVPTVSFSKNGPTPPPTYQQEKVASAVKVQLTGQNMLGERTDTASLMSQPKSTPLIEDRSDVMCSIEYQLEQLMPTSLEHQTKPRETLANEDVNKNFANVEDYNKTKKVSSWASNYLQSIGHNNLKPIKINPSLTKNENQTVKTILTKNNKSNETVAQSAFLKGKTTFEAFNLTESSPEFIKPNEKKISTDKNIGSIETMHPANVNVCRARTNEQSEVHPIILPICQNITFTSVNSNIMLDTLYSNNNINKAPAYADLLAKDVGKATYCYNDGNRGIVIYDAIKSKINHELAIEQKQHTTMNLPTHKKMCEDFIKEISNNKASKSEWMKKPTKLNHPETKLKTIVKKDKKQLNKESIRQETKKQTSDKERVKNSKSSIKIDKSMKKEKKLDKECLLNKKQENNTSIDLKDFDSISKRILEKETDKKPESQSPDRQKLKRMRANSDDLYNSSTGIRTHTPIKSVVHVTENCQNKPKRQCLDQNFDLRSKLSRVNERIYKKTHIQSNTLSMNKIPKSRENLKITVEHQTDEKQKTPKKFGGVKKSKKCKKLKLIINVVCPGSDDETTSSDSTYSETENNPTHNMDLSFLDDFNVDEIVDCLKHSPKHKIKSPSPSDNKMEDTTKRPEFKLSTILNMLSAKSAETNTFKNPASTDFMTEDASSTTSNDLNNPSLATDVKITSLKSDENENNIKNITTHALLSETKLQLDQKKTASWEEGYQNAKCGIKEEDVTNKPQEHEQTNENNEKIIIDESVFIVDPEISIIDLTDETIIDASPTNNITVFTKPNHHEKPINEYKKSKVKSVGINNIENNLKPSPNTYRNSNKEKESETINGQQMDVDADLKLRILAKNEKIFIDLTNDSVDDEIKSNISINTSVAPVDVKCKLFTETLSINKVGKQKGAVTETYSANAILKQPNIHLIPLPNENVVTSKENKKPIETKTLKDSNNYKTGNCKHTDESKSKEIENARPTYKGNGNSKTKEIICPDNLNKKAFESNPVKIVVNNETVHSGTNIKIMKEKRALSFKKNEMNRKQCTMVTEESASKANEKMSKVFETKSAQRLIKNIVESVWGGKDNPENAPKTNDGGKFETENKCKVNSGTQNNEPENTSRTNNGMKNETEKSSKINSTIKNKPENTKTNNRIKNKPEELHKINSGPKIEPKIIKGTKNEPDNTSITTNVTTNETENTKTNNNTNNAPKNKSEIKSGAKTEPHNGAQTEPENSSKTNSGIKNETNKTSNINSSTKNKPENTKTNNGTNNETVNTSKTNNSIANKVKNDSNLTAEHKSLVVLLEKRMLEYLHKDMKIIRLIHLGKFSKIFSCKHPNGRTYAAKLILEHEKSSYLAGMKKEQMLRIIQQDIPKENLNTVELIDGFGVQRYWCLLTEYYPKNLKQVLKAQIKPFHIDLVQDLARQLLTAVIVLRNNGIVHSDIKPAHILMNANQDRIKLCGFDAAYCLNSVRLIPNTGTSNYRAPEIILGFSAGFSIDVWSSALVIHEMATNQQLFTGVYNNDILYKQMSTFGSLPMDMILASLYKNNHFTGRTFKRKVGVGGRDTVLCTRFYKTKRLQMSIIVAYNHHWATNDVYQRDSDMFKLTALHRLLEQMLLLDPRRRLAIEFVCADPFIYEMFV